MDQNKLKEYLEKLEEFERALSEDEESIDDQYINEIESTLKLLVTDSIAHGDPHSIVPKNSTTLDVMATIRCNFKRLTDNAVIPKYSKVGDAGLDLTATSMSINKELRQITYGTGIAIEIPKGFVGLVFPRSSIRNTVLSLTNSVGVIDSGYRGEIMATFKYPNSPDSDIYQVGERIVQLMVVPYPIIELIEVNELTDTERGEGGFGSTGK